MKTAICHYSLNRRYTAEKWTPLRLVQEAEALGVKGFDFHTSLLGKIEGAAETITGVLARTPLALSGLSLASNFNRPKAEEFKAEVEKISQWIAVAAKVKAPVSRLFGGSLSPADRTDPAARAAAWQRMVDGVAAVTKVAQKFGVVLALENHGCLPCTAEEQIKVITMIDSPCLRATVDVGNYMAGGQEGHVATALAAPYAAYVHFKDNKRIPDAGAPGGWRIEPAALGEGVVDLAACVAALRKARYTGFVALEYEAAEDERTAVPRSVAAMKKLLE